MKYELITVAAMIAALGACQPPSGEQAGGEDNATDITTDEPAAASNDAAPSEPPALISGDETYKALGTEPFWNVEITAGGMTYTPMGGEKVVVADVSSEPTNKGWLFEGGPLSVEIDMSAASCSDGMSDIRYRHAVTVLIDGQTRNGCGGGEVPPGSLAQTGWQVSDINGTALAVGSDDAPRVTFANGKIAGNSGCNGFQAPYVTGDDWLATSGLSSTRRTCASDVMERENIMLEILRGRANVHHGEGGALIVDDGHYQMTLIPGPCAACEEEAASSTPLANRWRLVSMDESPISSGREPAYIEFGDGSFTASVGCNRISGSYRFGEDRILFGAPRSTRMACPGELGGQETAFLRAIADPMQYRIVGSQLFMASRNATLSYTLD